MADALSPGVRARQWAFFMSWRLRERMLGLLAPRTRVDVRGLEITLPSDNWITSFRSRTYASKEPETLDWIDRLSADDVLFDVGANIGLYSLYAAKRHPGMSIAAFEPEFANLHLLRDNVIENSVDRQVTIYPVALGAASGLSYLHVQDLHPGAALHSVSADPMTMTRTNRPVLAREGVVQMALDAFCTEAGIVPTCMKVDVDGSEPDVLTGAKRTLAAEVFRSLLIEMPGDGNARARCEALLTASGLVRAWSDASGRTDNEVWARA